MHFTYFANKLTSIMKDNIYDRFEAGKRSGKLDMKRLYKVPTNNDKVFKKKVEKTNKHYNICLLVDASGSMEGERIEMAALFTDRLAKSLKANNINYKVAFFDNGYEVIKLHKYKNLLNNYDGNFGGGTNMLKALCEVENLIDSSLGKEHNILIVMTDGDPDPFSAHKKYSEWDLALGSDDCYYKNEITNQIEKDKYFLLHKQIAALELQTNVLAVGIGTNYVAKFFNTSLVTNNESEFYRGILTYLSKHINRG
jgi:hypothetical protein